MRRSLSVFIFVASNLAEPGSCIFSYINTDSATTNDRQDADLLNDVIRTIENKNLHVVQILQWNTSDSLPVSGNNLNHTTSEPDVTDFVQCIPNERLLMKSTLKGNSLLAKLDIFKKKNVLHLYIFVRGKYLSGVQVYCGHQPGILQ